MKIAEEPGLKEKVRVYVLANQLNMESKDLLDICKQAGLNVKNQLSSLDPDQRDMIEQLVKRGTKTPPPAPKPAAPSVLPDVGKPMRILQPRPQQRRDEPAPSVRPQEPVIQPQEPAAETVELVPPQPHVEVSTPVPSHVIEELKPVAQTPPATLPEEITPVVSETPIRIEQPAPPIPPSAPPEVKRPEPPKSPALPDISKRGMRDLGGAARTPERRRPRDMRPTNAPHLQTPLPPLKPMIKKDVKKEEPRQIPIKKLDAAMLKQSQERPLRPEDVLRPAVPAVTDEVVEEEGDKKGDPKKKRPTGVAGRDTRQQARNERAKKRKTRGDGEVTVQIEHGKVKTVFADERPQRGHHRLKKQKDGPKPRKGKVPIEVPITVRSLSEAVGVPSVQLLFKLRDHMDVTPTINTTVDPELAEMLALEFGCELNVKRPVNAEEEMIGLSKEADNPADLVPRAPVVTVMGHVDHGKTSLLDRIRKSNVAASEAGGITQVIRAWRVDHNGHPITFLDTPGHEAFTKMRARGAQVTDIAVIVVAADDGVMPQTQEAINHAKAAGVSLVIAINKVDLPNANLNKTRQQLYSLNILPDDMGGDTPFVETSAATGKGIDELLDQLSVVAELKELRANPNKAARGTCLEAMLSEGEGVRATLLVQDGTLKRGDVILCGAAFGRVRQMYDDQGRSIQEAGPSVPVRITGLDEVPNADDPFMVVPDLSVAREIGEKRKSRHFESAQVQRARPAFTLESLTDVKVAEVKIIIKADFRGSIEAIRKEMEKLHHDEVRVRILEASTGGITENDVWLALTSPEDTMIVGFNVVPDERARALAEEKGVQIRQYDVIYNLTDDIRSALEGKLKPREEVVHLGRAVVRQTFKISRTGTIAGCYVTQGTIQRSAKVRVIRDGIIIYPPKDRTASLDSLKRFKDDASEVREGFECGLKIANYDDLKIGDVVEAYRVDQVQRTLE